jgi:hypothetical protein
LFLAGGYYFLSIYGNIPTTFHDHPFSICCVVLIWLNAFIDFIKPEKFYSCNSKLNPMGIITLDIIFPHVKNNIQITVELVLMEDFRMTYIVLGNDYIINYGIDVINSNGRYFTINGDLITKFELGITDKMNLVQL